MHTHNRLKALCPGLRRQAGTRKKIFTHSHPSWSSDILYQLCHLLGSIASSLFNLCAWQSFSRTSLQVPFGFPLGLWPSTSYYIYFLTQSSSFCNTCSYHRSLFWCSTNVMSSIPNLSLSSLLGHLYFTLMPHIHLTTLISARWSATSFSFLTGQVSLPHNILLRTQLLHNLPLKSMIHPYWYLPTA